MRIVSLASALFWSVLFLCSFSSGFEPVDGELYRDDSPIQGQFSGCGQFCQASPEYYQSYVRQRDIQARNFKPANYSQDSEYVSQRGEVGEGDMMQALNWTPFSRVGNIIARKSLRWSRAALRMGIEIQERDKSFGSAFLREIRRPVLYEIRDALTGKYKKKKTTFEEKLKSWVLEQTIDTGASSIGLESYDATDTGINRADFDIKGYKLKYYPRVDPSRGRYGVRLKMKKYWKKRRPFNIRASYNYCESAWGFGGRTCGYLHELNAGFSVGGRSSRLTYGAYVSYQTKSLDEEAYIVDGEAFDHKPWVGGIEVTYFLK